MSSLPLDVLTWQATIASEDGPRDYTMRLVLLTLGVLLLTAEKTALRATSLEIARASGLSRNWVMLTLRNAVADGWVQRGHPCGQGRAWQAYEYTISYPNSDLGSLVERGTSTQGARA